MAEFLPRDYEVILAEMIAHVQGHTDISDFSVGSATRTILEAAAEEDSEAYFQMTQLLEIFSIFTAKGENLRKRLADFGISPEPAKTATGRVRFFDKNLTGDRAAVNAPSASAGLYLFDSSDFPVNGFPYTVRIGEGTTRSQDVLVSLNNVTTNLLSFSSPILYDVFVGDRVSLVTGAVAHTINAGQQIMCPATNAAAAKLYATQEQAYIDAGNYYSNAVAAKSTASGADGNVNSGRVTQFLGGEPFSGAGVTSVTAMAGGRAEESDEDLVQRAIEQLQSLSRGTVAALKSAAKGVEDTTTGQRVLSANLVEDFVNNEVIVYIDDGTGFIAEYVTHPTNTTSGSLTAGGVLVSVVDGSLFATAGNILLIDGVDTELVQYTSKASTNALATDALAENHTSGIPVMFVDVLSQATEEDQLRFRLHNFPVVRNSEVIYAKTTSGWSQLTANADYKVNKGTGDFILTAALETGSTIVAGYSYYINLAASVQKVLEGDPDDEINFPGAKAAGIILSVEAPSIRRIDIRLSLSAKPGFTEVDLYDAVRKSVEDYVTSLKLGEDVIVSRIYDAVHDNAGVASVKVVSPAQDVTVLENELPVPYSQTGLSLVVIT